MHEIATPRQPQGSIKIVGKTHGALNCIVTPADGSQWFFKQFVTEDEFDRYVSEYGLTVTNQGEYGDI